MSAPLRIRYRFDLPDGTRSSLDFEFDPKDFRLQGPPPAVAPFWTELGFSQCANCPLSELTAPRCPAALHMVEVIERLKTWTSFDVVDVTVIQAERSVQARTSVQNALSSVLGLVMATSGCPWTDHLRPMARFHLPFASETESLYRAVSMFLVAREFAGVTKDSGFAALERLYENLHVVNRDMSRRLGAATRTDPARNAIALLDAQAALLPAALETSLAELKPLFDAWKNKIFPAI